MAETDRERARLARAAQRGDWSVSVFKLGEEPSDNLSRTTTAAERLGMMWGLATDAWAASGQAVPDYDRSNLPSKIFRRGEQPPEHREPANR